MEDRFGNEINIGDTVVFVNKTRYSQLDYGIVSALKNNEKIEIRYSVLCFYEKHPSNGFQDIIIAKGGLRTDYAVRESRNVSVMKNVLLQIEENL